jgi:radical SAM protein with 4Fe4S-binding SPASM domain
MGSVARFKRIYVEITSACNLCCTFCQETLRKPHFMSVDEFRHVINEIKAYTNYIYLHVKGEPLLHPHLEEILEICQEFGITVNLTTNGTLIYKNLEILKKFPVHQINISMHSADDNDCIDMDTYISELFLSCEQLLSETKTEISLRLWNTKNDPTLFGQKNFKVKERLHINVQSPFEWPSLENHFHSDRGFCQGLRHHMAILSDGTVVPCCLDGNAVMSLGNIFTTQLSSILESERSKAFIEGFRAMRAVEPLCKHCSFKERFSKKMK